MLYYKASTFIPHPTPPHPTNSSDDLKVGNHKVVPWAPFLCHTCRNFIKHFRSLTGLSEKENMSDYQCKYIDLIKDAETLREIILMISDKYDIDIPLTPNSECSGLINHRSHQINTSDQLQKKDGSQCGGLCVQLLPAQI